MNNLLETLAPTTELILVAPSLAYVGSSTTNDIHPVNSGCGEGWKIGNCVEVICIV